MFAKRRSLDERVNDALLTYMPHPSRRSFLSKTTRYLFGLAGASLVSQAPVFERKVAHAAAVHPTFAYCGGNGVECSSTCKITGQVSGGYWEACCQDTTSNCWVRVRYRDYCVNSIPNPDPRASCHTFSSGGGNWCAAEYSCTVLEIKGTYSSSTNCNNAKQGPVLG